MAIKKIIANLKIIKRDQKDAGNVNLEKKWYQLPATNADYLFEFKYKLFSLSTTIMLLATLIMPLILGLIVAYIPIGQGTKKNGLMVIQIIKIILASFGISYSLAKEKSFFIKSGAWSIYVYILSQVVTALLAGLVGTIFSDIFYTNEDKTVLSRVGKIMTLAIQTIVSILATILILWKAPELRKRIWLTIKQNYILLIGVIAIFVLILFVTIIAFGSINQIINGTENSENEQSIREMAILLSGKIILFFATVLMIPILEELATRQGIFALSNNRWLGLIISTIYFATMHLDSAGDFNHILPYIGTSLIFSLLFVVSRENILYPIILHILNNLGAYIYMLYGKAS